MASLRRSLALWLHWLPRETNLSFLLQEEAQRRLAELSASAASLRAQIVSASTRAADFSSTVEALQEQCVRSAQQHSPLPTRAVPKHSVYHPTESTAAVVRTFELN